MKLFFVKALMMSFFPFYQVNFSIEAFPKDLTYVEYSHGHEVGKIVLSKEEASYVTLKELLAKNKEGWRYDLNTYAPGRLFIATNVKINCIAGGALIINYEDAASDWVQISKKDVSGSCPVVSLIGSNKK